MTKARDLAALASEATDVATNQEVQDVVVDEVMDAK